MIYVADPDLAAGAWGLRRADAGVNVLLAKPPTDVPFQRTRCAPDGLILAAVPQVACDLVDGPGRAPEEAEELIAWMGRNEPAWRA